MTDTAASTIDGARIEQFMAQTFGRYVDVQPAPGDPLDAAYVTHKPA